MPSETAFTLVPYPRILCGAFLWLDAERKKRKTEEEGKMRVHMAVLAASRVAVHNQPLALQGTQAAGLSSVTATQRHVYSTVLL